VWATEVPKATITIPSIKCSKEVKWYDWEN
jgi:hypothetical protein